MATRNPDLKIPMLLTELPSGLRPRSSNAAERKPRFHEDFDAPLLYDLLDNTSTSPTSPFADNSSQTSSSPRPSLDEGSNKVPTRAIPPYLQKRNLTSPIIQLQTEWASEPRRRTSVHDKMRKLARRSLVMVRQRPSRLDDDLGVMEHQRPTSGTLTVNHEYDLGSTENLQAVVTADETDPKES